jgi:hypothetical protein
MRDYVACRITTWARASKCTAAMLALALAGAVAAWLGGAVSSTIAIMVALAIVGLFGLLVLRSILKNAGNP